MVFSLFCILVDRPIRGATAPPPRWLRYCFHASILLLIAVELVRLWCINFISGKLFECYYGPLVRCVDTCLCYLKGDINCNYYYYYYCSSFKNEQQYKTVTAQTRLLKIVFLCLSPICLEFIMVFKAFTVVS